MQNERVALPKFRKAAEYVRMSRDLQKYSIENQKQAIAEYALLHDFMIVRTYADEGKSGVLIKGRDALQQLIADIQSRRAEFDTVLVYDVSRWGRFQDADEAAYYEFICKSCGVSIKYCAEQFENDNSTMSTVLKGIKRAMAGEYSRELSAKIVRAHRRMASMGFHQGGRPNYGLRRLLVDDTKNPKFVLNNSQRKSLQTDRVILVPGPPNEVRTVQEIFYRFAVEHASIREIIRGLTEKGTRNARGNSWTIQNVSDILSCEKYVGTYVYNRTSERLHQRRIYLPSEKWLRVPNTIEPIVDARTFAEAQCRLGETWKISDVDLLNYLTATWCVTGYLSCGTLALNHYAPSPACYLERFGCLQNAYRHIGFRRSHHYRYEDIGDFLRQCDRNLIARITSTREAAEGRVRYDEKTEVLMVDGTLRVRTHVVAFLDREKRGAGWRVHRRYVKPCDWILVARLKKSNTAILDYYLLRYPDQPTFRFSRNNLRKLDSYKLKSLVAFYRLCRKAMAEDRK